ncbi:MAG: hypothetical protein AAFO70_09435 [Pseudomonadota bacterium]
MQDFIFWNWPFAAASALMFITFLVHVIAGGREAVKPLFADESIPKQAKVTLYYAWHLISAGLFASALVFLAAALRPEWTSIAWAAGLMVAIFALVGVVQTVFMRLPLAMLPQWVVFAPIAALAIWGATR